MYGTSIGLHNASTLKLFDQMTGKHPREAFRQDVHGVLPVFAYRKDHPDVVAARLEYDRSCKSYRPEGVKIVLPEDVDNPAFRRSLTLWRYDMDAIQARIDEIHAEGYASVLCGTRALLESAGGGRGRERFYMDLGLGEDWLEPYLDILTDAAIAEAKLLLQCRPDIFCYGEDVGCQQGLIISPRQWNELFTPRHKRIVEAVKEVSPGTAVAFHCCGDSRDLIGPLIDIGVDILNPIQPAAIDPALARRLAGERLVLWGGVCVQHTMPHGTREDVFNEVKLRMETIGKDGRYILSPAHMINDDISWENIVAFFEAADEFGRYEAGRGSDRE